MNINLLKKVSELPIGSIVYMSTRYSTTNDTIDITNEEIKTRFGYGTWQYLCSINVNNNILSKSSTVLYVRIS